MSARWSAILIASALVGCSRSTPPDVTAADLAQAEARIAALDSRVSALEHAKVTATAAPAEPPTPRAELRVLDGFNSPPHEYPTMEACEQAKARVEQQFAARVDEARARGAILNAGVANCLAL